jgi:hypothetical protein
VATRPALGRRADAACRKLVSPISRADDDRDRPGWTPRRGGALSGSRTGRLVAPRPDRERRSEAIDLAGAGRDHAFDLIAAALTPPLGCDPHLMTFAADCYWRGETHRVCDRPGAVSRLLEELAAAGVSQVIIVSAVAAPPPPHR